MTSTNYSKSVVRSKNADIKSTYIDMRDFLTKHYFIKKKSPISVHSMLL